MPLLLKNHWDKRRVGISLATRLTEMPYNGVRREGLGAVLKYKSENIQRAEEEEIED